MRAAHYIPVLQQAFDVYENSYSVVVKLTAKMDLCHWIALAMMIILSANSLIGSAFK